MKDEILKKAKTQSDSMLEDAKRQINSEKDQALTDIRTEVVSLSLEVAGKLIKKNLTEKDNQAIINNTLKEIQLKNEA
jgi:F-type H+-transporting ATPase subunit b